MCRKYSGCEARIRSIASALAFLLENDLLFQPEIAVSTGSAAASICCSVFGRDEGGSEFTFTSQHVDFLMRSWVQKMRGEGIYAIVKFSPDTLLVADLCVSDKNKLLLLQHSSFIPYLVDALLLDPAHPRAELKAETKAWCQATHSECLAQLAVFPEGREALLKDPSVHSSLKAVVERGLSDEARQHASAALLALSDRQMANCKQADGQKHVMLSYQWAYQATIQRVNESLISRGYATWFDLTNMKGEPVCCFAPYCTLPPSHTRARGCARSGSTMDAMSDAIEGAAVMLYSVSLQYKESANVSGSTTYVAIFWHGVSSN